MERENKRDRELVEKMTRMLEEYDLDALMEVMADEIRHHAGGSGPYSGTHEGKDAVRIYFENTMKRTIDTGVSIVAEGGSCGAAFHPAALRAVGASSDDVRTSSDEKPAATVATLVGDGHAAWVRTGATVRDGETWDYSYMIVARLDDGKVLETWTTFLENKDPQLVH